MVNFSHEGVKLTSFNWPSNSQTLNVTVKFTSFEVGESRGTALSVVVIGTLAALFPAFGTLGYD